mmetsp:Transcript_10189/g.41277  ORF Transcript_10189/g.41277 Transcript_10189/m.41277 type:complete len:109 (+) Transcript_10189:280-606(+)
MQAQRWGGGAWSDDDEGDPYGGGHDEGPWNVAASGYDSALEEKEHFADYHDPPLLADAPSPHHDEGRTPVSNLLRERAADDDVAYQDLDDVVDMDEDLGAGDDDPAFV